MVLNIDIKYLQDLNMQQQFKSYIEINAILKLIW